MLAVIMMLVVRAGSPSGATAILRENGLSAATVPLHCIYPGATLSGFGSTALGDSFVVSVMSRGHSLTGCGTVVVVTPSVTVVGAVAGAAELAVTASVVLVASVGPVIDEPVVATVVVDVTGGLEVVGAIAVVAAAVVVAGAIVVVACPVVTDGVVPLVTKLTQSNIIAISTGKLYVYSVLSCDKRKHLELLVIYFPIENTVLPNSI